MRACSRCGEEKADDEFYADSARPSGVYPQCKPCVKLSKRESVDRIREQDPDAYRARQREYQARWKSRFPDKRREGERRRNLKKFGMTVEEYDLMVEDQDAKCAICGLPSEGKALAVDHNHETGEVRGLLCGPCNMALGQLEPGDRLDAATQYLMRYLK